MAFNPLKIDPSRTTMLRRRFIGEMNKRFKTIRGKILELVVVDDVFGLALPKPFTFNVDKQAWRFRTDDKKLDAFNTWFEDQVSQNVLQVDVSGKPWTAEYVESAYKKGAQRAYMDTHSQVLAKSPDFYLGSRAQFLTSAFGAPEAVSKMRLLGTRTFDQLKGVSAAMGQQMSRILADGLSQGQGPMQIARTMNKTILGLTKSRARVIARTEIINAHAEGQLDAFERLGVEEVGLMAEWKTARDDRVCPLCQPLDRVVMKVKKARGLIPRHPNCRCAWMPANIGEDTSQQKRGDEAAQAVADSVKAERPGKELAAARDKSTWVGKTQVPKPEVVEKKETIPVVVPGMPVLPSEGVGSPPPTKSRAWDDTYSKMTRQQYMDAATLGETRSKAVVTREVKANTDHMQKRYGPTLGKLKPEEMEAYAWYRSTDNMYWGEAKKNRKAFERSAAFSKQEVDEIIASGDKHVKVMDRIIKKAPSLDREMPLYRGLALHWDEDVSSWKGKTMKSSTFTSTSLSRKEAASYIGVGVHNPDGSMIVGKTKVLMQMKASKGQKLLFSRPSREVILPRGQSTKITDVVFDKKTGVWLVTGEFVKPKAVVKKRVKKEIVGIPVRASGKKWTEKDHRLVSNYTSYGSIEIVEAQLGKKLSDLSGMNKQQLLKRATEMETSLKKLRGVRGVSYRGMKFDNPEARNAFLESIQKEDAYRFKSFQSTSSSKRVAKEFSSEREDLSVLMVIDGKSGRDIAPYSRNKGEEEILFMKGSTFEITKIKGSTVYLSEI